MVDCIQFSTYFFKNVFNLKNKGAIKGENWSKLQKYCLKNKKVFIQTDDLKKKYANRWNRTRIQIDH